jgi:hypothetical protein
MGAGPCGSIRISGVPGVGSTPNHKSDLIKPWPRPSGGASPVPGTPEILMLPHSGSWRKPVGRATRTG